MSITNKCIWIVASSCSSLSACNMMERVDFREILNLLKKMVAPSYLNSRRQRLVSLQRK